jgi:hypothetical protein
MRLPVSHILVRLKRKALQPLPTVSLPAQREDGEWTEYAICLV